MDPPELVEPPRTAGERDTLTGFLDYYRTVVVRKVAGVSQEGLRTRLEPGELTLGGIIQHLTEVERHWFRDVFAGEPGLQYRWSRDDPDGELRVDPDATAEELIDAYRREAALASEVVASASLDDLSRREERRVTLRWILVHMIEETARHAGHADLIRESIDGTVGD